MKRFFGMKKLLLTSLAISVAAWVTWAADWPGVGGNPQRDGWAKSEKAFTKENAGKIELLYKYKAENQVRGANALTSPVVNGFMITHLGFKEMLAFAGSGDNAYSVDADLNRIVWKVHFDYSAVKPQVTNSTPICPGGLTSSMAMPGSSTVTAGRGGGGRAPGAGRGPLPGVPPGANAAPGPGRATIPAPQLLSTGNFGRAANFAVISSDGRLHVLKSSTGAERTTPIPFVPPNSKVSALNVANNSVFVATQDGCGGNPNALFAIDLTPESPKPVAFETGGSPSGSGGTAISADGTVFAQIPDGKGEVAGPYNDTVLALSPDLKVKDYFTPSGPPGTGSASGATPLVFTSNGREYVVAGGRDGRLHLLDAKSPGGADHHTALFSTEAIAANNYQGTFASWEDEGGGRWIYASTGNAVIGFQLEMQGGKPVLTQKWRSEEMQAPAPVVTANGLVFALSTGQSVAKKPAGRAILHVLDGESGKGLYSSGNLTSTWSSAGLAIANRRIYFTTHDNLVYSLGFLAEQPQLTGK